MPLTPEGAQSYAMNQCGAAAVRVFSRSANAWKDGTVVKQRANDMVRIEYKVGDQLCRKDMNVNSEHIVFLKLPKDKMFLRYPEVSRQKLDGQLAWK